MTQILQRSCFSFYKLFIQLSIENAQLFCRNLPIFILTWQPCAGQEVLVSATSTCKVQPGCRTGSRGLQGRGCRALSRRSQLTLHVSLRLTDSEGTESGALGSLHQSIKKTKQSLLYSVWRLFSSINNCQFGLDIRPLLSAWGQTVSR